ncbi:multiple sugar transport system permease protein [Rhizobium sp. BK313]|jgi:multiple sugar transport system permease protein|uniref:carbohydrate ABC transporter permease n=1 Tax=Rhizobium sp. BK313 TaxID=2587081 RepID=UPI00105C231C|nr:sugar ABC transporter permease [Rhizobium sp. BK313]MBB3458196.1 multiple sugar transport system permease protein [Rhizobium sp. BK313]
MRATARGQGPITFILPALLLLAIFIVYPLVSTVWMSFTNDSDQFVGLDNYQSVVEAGRTARAVKNTIYFVGASIVVQLLLGTIAGIVLNEKFKGQAIARSLTLVPWVVPGIVGAMTWAWMFHTDYGVINYILLSTGLISTPVRWLSDPNIVLPSLIAVNVWKMFPFVAIMVLAGLQAIPKSLYEAAQVDGANFWHEIRYITLPQLRPMLISITLLLVIAGVNSITIIYSMTGGGPADRSLITSIQIFVEAFQFFNFHTASALSILFFLVSTAIIVVYIVADNNKRSAQE